jgi:Tfp pilus assembly protein PilF
MSKPKNERSQTIQVQIDMNTGESVSSKIENDGSSVITDNEIAVKIHESVSNFFIKKVDSTIIELKNCIEKFDFVGAINLIRTSEKSGLFMGKLKVELLDKILKIDKTKLPDEELKDYYRYLIMVSTKISRYDLVYEQLKDYLLEKYEIQDNRLKTGIKLSIANGAAQLGKSELAYKLYNDLIREQDTDTISRAWTYSGLCSINDIEDPITMKYLYAAAELFLEGGNRKKAVDCFMRLASIWENQDIEKSLNLIDKAIGLLDVEDNIENNYVSGILHRKAALLTSLNKDLEAVKSIKKAIEIREALIGIEYELYSSYSLGKIIANKIKDEKFEKECIQKAKDIEVLIPDENFYLQKKLESFLKSKKLEDEIVQKIENGSSQTLKFSLYLGQALLDTNSVTEKLEKLDKAKQILKSSNKLSRMEWTTLCVTYAKIYLDEGDDSDALRWYKEALKHNPFSYIARQNYGGILWKQKNWTSLESFFESQIKQFGNMPNLSYGYGRALFENEKFGEAAYYLNLADGKSNPDATNYLKEALNKSKIISPTYDEKQIPNIDLSIKDELEKILNDFKTFIQSDKRMEFWKRDNNKHKWKDSPEQLAKNFLHSYLKGSFSDSIEVIEELYAGAGKIDLYVKLKNKLKIVIELKICGSPGYSLNYAQEGIKQIVHYMENKNTCLGYLIIFDGRKRDFGKGIKPIIAKKSNTIFVNFIQVTPTIK